MDLSFIIIEYHCLEEIGPCLAQLQKNSMGTTCEYIITSNSGYSLIIQNRIRKDFPNVQWIFNEKNGGFAYAMNRGIAKATGEVIVLLAPDARVLSDLGPAQRFLHENSKVAVLGPKVVDRQGNVQDSARCFLSPYGLVQRSFLRLIKHRKTILERKFDYNQVQPVDWVIGAFMMVKKSALEKVGMLDEEYFLYVEDMDWCKRFWDNGFQVYYSPDLVVEYEGSRQSTIFLLAKKNPDRYTFLHLRSYLRFVCKHRYFYRKSSGAVT